MLGLRQIVAVASMCAASLLFVMPAGAEPSARASCLGQYAFFLAQTSVPSLGQAVVAPGATSAPGAIAEAVVPDATLQPHTYHCSS